MYHQRDASLKVPDKSLHFRESGRSNDFHMCVDGGDFDDYHSGGNTGRCGSGQFYRAPWWVSLYLLKKNKREALVYFDC